jgi:D-lactate dehydrogenase (cytochrome)
MAAEPAPTIEVDCGLIEALGGLLGERLSLSPAVREHHGKDESYFPLAPPDAVAFPTSADEVVAIVKLCAKHQTPIIPFGAGTSVEGHVLAVRGGICVDMTGMDRILEVNAEDLDCRVQAGVTRKRLNEELRDTGLFFPIDPGADASLGGMAATRASGTNAVRYGTMRENVLSLTVVLADGRIIRTAGRARKSSAGYDLTRLFVGSEGTLGIITEVGLRLFGVPERISAAVCAFASVEAAVNTVITTIQTGVPVARMELLNGLTMQTVNDYAKLGYAATPHLFMEFHGTEAGVEEQVAQVKAIATDFGGSEFQWASRTEDRNRLWQARHDAYFAGLQLRPGARAVSTDVCVPISRLAECIAETEADIAQASMPITLFGHVGDGNFHLVILIDPDDPGELAEAKRLNHRLVMRALAMDGTCTGEHGIGVGKMDFLVAEHGEAVNVMRTVKQALDPGNILNPGKMLRI